MVTANKSRRLSDRANAVFWLLFWEMAGRPPLRVERF